jgi:hypothetical protein
MHVADVGKYLGGRGIEETCGSLATHKVTPYGTSPSIQLLQVQGREACLIWPSPDQYEDETSVVVRLPDSGWALYLTSDAAHLADITSTHTIDKERQESRPTCTGWEHRPAHWLDSQLNDNLRQYRAGTIDQRVRQEYGHQCEGAA